MLNEQVEKERFKVDSLESANWVFRKLKAIDSKMQEIADLRDKEIVRIDKWYKDETEQYEKDKQYFEYLLNEYYLNEKEKDSKFKLSTPYGKVTSRKTSKWSYDEDRLKEYIKSNNLPFIKVKEEIDKAGIKKVFKDGVNQETGEVIPGVTIEEQQNISVKVAE